MRRNDKDKDRPAAGGDDPRRVGTAMLSRELIGMAKAIGDHHDLTITEVFDRFARPGILREWRRVVRLVDPTLAPDLGGES